MSEYLDEGDNLPEGLKVTYTKGYREPVYMCPCGRMQTLIAVAVVEQLGWRRIAGDWKCPFCTGNTKNLERVFNGDTDDV